MHAQPGIFENLQEHSDILLLNASSAAADTRKGALQRLQAAIDNAHAQHVAADLTITVGFGPTFVTGMAPGQTPNALHPMPHFHGDEFNPAETQTDVVIQICSNVKYANYACADSLLKALAPAFSLAAHHQGFGFPGSRGALGFIDGTGNPGAEEKPHVALIGAEDPAFQGGSYMTFRKIVEDVSRWDALSLSDQEDAIGRRKRDSEEFNAPGTSHQKKSNVVRDGEEVQILRRSIPFWANGERGLLFVCFQRDLAQYETIKGNMVSEDDGGHDRLEDTSHPVAGGYYFMPPIPAEGGFLGDFLF
ncbi:MAG: putative iron-dependent peroxidase [Chloroflexi bacterium]|jgi:putative iron-dependent peroxidase|nr:MAG: putative iron-dependent peroxidase [Chloroflexota bacterium]